jgi:hypothetical protein
MDPAVLDEYSFPPAQFFGAGLESQSENRDSKYMGSQSEDPTLVEPVASEEQDRIRTERISEAAARGRWVLEHDHFKNFKHQVSQLNLGQSTISHPGKTRTKTVDDTWIKQAEQITLPTSRYLA